MVDLLGHAIVGDVKTPHALPMFREDQDRTRITETPRVEGGGGSNPPKPSPISGVPIIKSNLSFGGAVVGVGSHGRWDCGTEGGFVGDPAAATAQPNGFSGVRIWKWLG